MPKNKGKGGKNRRRGKNENESQKRELIYKEDGQEYAKVERLLGNGRLEAYCFDGVKRLCHIRGKLRKKVSLILCLTFFDLCMDIEFDSDRLIPPSHVLKCVKGNPSGIVALFLIV
ncbi:unnamed protein product [Echinostoma caproni]|uniref:Eukaryotic translation initiation factor 4C n=1 Tax=Echinostoma caproni TaxID=27848 RepID=A0A183B6L4_9TREM|nr:unnamed protein product [Echinostoma caproni]